MNPWSILRFLGTGMFSGHWLAERPSDHILHGTATNDPIVFLKNRLQGVKHHAICRADLALDDTVAALFQAGYLTIEPQKFEFKEDPTYSLRVPNTEIRNGRFATLIEALFGVMKRPHKEEADSFREAVDSMDAYRLTAIFNSLFGLLPARHHRENESRYRTVVFGYCYGMGFFPEPEVLEAEGVPDLRLKLNDEGLWAVIELKFKSCMENDPDNSTKAKIVADLAEKALNATTDKNYVIPVIARAGKLVRIGLGVTNQGQCRALVSLAP
jgi:hypothetical protein